MEGAATPGTGSRTTRSFNAVYIGTGNGSPWNRRIRSPGGGDNLFLSSIVALNADNGEYLWHYQTSPGETWDYTSTMDIVLADRGDGWPDGEGDPSCAEERLLLRDRSLDREADLGPAVRTRHLGHPRRLRERTAGGNARRARTGDGEAEIWPSAHGAHSWQAMSYSPRTGLVYLPTMEMGGRYVDMGADTSWRSVDFVGGSGVGALRDPGAGGRQPRQAAGVGSRQAAVGVGRAAEAPLERRDAGHRGATSSSRVGPTARSSPTTRPPARSSGPMISALASPLLQSPTS